ncbi:MAG TPA: hypothetical protein VHA33_00230 [Candidatus Angelobacter sp.]|jgi:hypothetical protein|nr:hypothetical protein [Candidatus Angelobacter sp.]
MVEKLTGLPKVGLANFLGPIQDYCKRHKLPQLTALVVNERTGIPGEGFHTLDDIFKAQSRVFVYDWLKDNVPTPDELEKSDHHKED